MKICQGNSIHECKDCGEPYFCYACPDEMNAEYTSNTCHPCLKAWLNGSLNAMPDIKKDSI